MQRYKDKVALITGAGTGIGAATAERLAQEGARVVLTGRRAEPLDAVAARCGGTAVTGDAADPDDMARIVAAAQAAYGPVDVLVCNAGGFGFGTLGDTADADWSAAVQANLNTAMVAARACLPDLIATRGAICMMSSIAGLAAGPEACGYVTMKHAMIGLMRSITRDYGRQGVRCNAVCPGWVRTEMADMEMGELMQRRGLASVEDAYALVTRDVPLGRPADSADVAAAVAFLCAPEARMISGAVLTVDGGATVVDVPTLAF